jgi:hypothetical protein
MTDTIFPRGKTAARPEAIRFTFADAFGADPLPEVPKAFGHPGLIQNWFMLGNDTLGNCGPVAAVHSEMLWSMEGGGPRMPVTTLDATLDYSAITGYSPYIPFSDRGTDMTALASYWRKTGMRDARGDRHRIEGYLGLRVGDAGQLAMATYLVGAVVIGLWLPNDADQNFLDGKKWDVSNAPQSGGHIVTCIGRNSTGDFLVVTWGRLQTMTPAFYAKYNDEAFAPISLERMKDRSPAAVAKLDAMLRQLAPIQMSSAADFASPVGLISPKLPTPTQTAAAFKAARKALDATGYGGWVSDGSLKPVSDSIATAVVQS